MEKFRLTERQFMVLSILSISTWLWGMIELNTGVAITGAMLGLISCGWFNLSQVKDDRRKSRNGY